MKPKLRIYTHPVRLFRPLSLYLHFSIDISTTITRHKDTSWPISDSLRDTIRQAGHDRLSGLRVQGTVEGPPNANRSGLSGGRFGTGTGFEILLKFSSLKETTSAQWPLTRQGLLFAYVDRLSAAAATIRDPLSNASSNGVHNIIGQR